MRPSQQERTPLLEALFFPEALPFWPVPPECEPQGGDAQFWVISSVPSAGNHLAKRPAKETVPATGRWLVDTGTPTNTTRLSHHFPTSWDHQPWSGHVTGGSSDHRLWRQSPSVPRACGACCVTWGPERH